MKVAASFTAAFRATKINTALAPTPEHAIKLFDFVIEKAERKAPEFETPEQRYFRWYEGLCDCVAESLLPEVEPMFIRYIKLLDKNSDPDMGFTPSYESYGGESRAQADAYAASIATFENRLLDFDR